jgi:hypothetical protein
MRNDLKVSLLAAVLVLFTGSGIYAQTTGSTAGTSSNPSGGTVHDTTSPVDANINDGNHIPDSTKEMETDARHREKKGKRKGKAKGEKKAKAVNPSDQMTQGQ